MTAPAPVPRKRLSLAGAVAAIEKHNGPADHRLPALRAELATEQLAEHIERIVSSAPPLTAEQADRLRSLLPAPAGARKAAAS